MEMTYTVITETKDKNLRKLYCDIALYIKSLDGVKHSNWFSKVIESSINLEIDCEEIIEKSKDKFIKMFKAERQFCYSELSKSSQNKHLKWFFSDLLVVK